MGVDGRIRYLNASARAFLGLGPDDPAEEVVYFDNLPKWTVEHFRGEILPSIDAEGSWSGELELVRPDGGRVPMLAQFLAHRGPMGDVEFYSATLREITELKAVEAELAYLATHDPLTGLPNRTLLVDRIGQALRRGEREGRQVAVLFLDLDDFKLVNDRYGHATGDEVLAVVAQRLRDAVRPADTVARYGGDEFVVLCDEVADLVEAQSVVERITGVIEAPIDAPPAEVRLRVSVGVAHAPPGASAGEMLAAADRAMYRTKIAHG
jgi:diguanylate cyclase (GGDEF)-like protein/PAS domain S-box-containing protein